jgi:hypothetical protein
LPLALCNLVSTGVRVHASDAAELDLEKDAITGVAFMARRARALELFVQT